MATESELRSQLAALKAEGRTESTSKKAAKIANQLKTGSYDGASNDGGDGFSGSIQRAIDLNRQAVQPAIDTLQKGIDPLKERYSQLLNQIKGSEERAVGQTTLTQSNELGRRGILPSSGLYDRTVEQAVNPVREQFAGIAGDVGFNQEQSIQAVNQAIANLQAGAGQGGISTALQMLGLEQNQNQFNQQQDLQRQIFEKVQLPQVQYELNKPYYQPKDSSDNFFQWLMSQMPSEKKGITTEQAPTDKPKASGVTRGNWYFDGYNWIPIVD